MNLFKTSFFTGIAVSIQIASSFIINKIVAIYVGPSGLAIIGQLQNFSQIGQTFANGAINQGIVKYVAEYRNDNEKKNKILSAAIVISLSCSIVIGLSIFLFRHFLAVNLLKNDDFSIIFVIFAFTITFFSLNSFLLSVLNGEREIRKYSLANISSSLVGLVITSFLVIYFHLLGALTALVLYQSIVFFVTLGFVVKSYWFKLHNLISGVDKKYLLKLFKYSLKAITTALTVPVAQIFLRNYIGNHLSWADAGYWQAVTKISDVYLSLITTTLGVYYLPRLSELKDNIFLQREIWHGYKTVLPIASLLALGIFLFKKEVVNILFTAQFYPMLELFKYQLIGDVVKISAWLLGYVMIARALTKTFIVTEIIFSFSYVVLSVVGLKLFGLKGVTMAFAVNYFMYLIAMWFLIGIRVLKIRNL